MTVITLLLIYAEESASRTQPLGTKTEEFLFREVSSAQEMFSSLAH